MEILVFILQPIIYGMQIILDAVHKATGSFGLAIISLSITARLITWPIARAARKAQAREKQKQDEMAPDLADAKSSLSGRARFEAIEVIYTRHDYHPIQSLSGLAPLALQIPFLVSAFILLSTYPALQGVSFLAVDNLLEPDRLVQIAGVSFNILPIGLTLFGIADSYVNPLATASTRRRFLIVAIVLLGLIYWAPSAVCLYWASSNFISLLSSLFMRFAARAN